jgi:hypothetical protein
VTRQRWVLTRRGENVLAVLWTGLILIGTAVVLMLMLGIAGWIETGL